MVDNLDFSSGRPRGAGGKFISEEQSKSIGTQDLPNLVHKSSKMTGALKEIERGVEEAELEKPFVSVNVNNPLSWMLKWFNQLRKKQTTTITFRLGIPLIALPVLVLALAGVFFELGKLTSSGEKEVQENQQTSYTISRVGRLKLVIESSGTVYFLILPSGEALRLMAPSGIDLAKLENKRILAFGKYDLPSNTLSVENIADLEVLPTTPNPVPTLKPTETPVQTYLPAPSPSSTLSPSPVSQPSITPEPTP